MRSLYSFIIKPQEHRYNNVKKVEDKELILNTEIEHAHYVSRYGVVLQTPINVKTGIKSGDIVLLHHNVFRRYNDMRGDEKDSSSYFEEDKYFVFEDQIFMYKRNNVWKPLNGYCFVKPIKNDVKYSNDKEKKLIGVLKYIDANAKKMGLKTEDVIGFTPHSEYEFIVDNERLYRVPINSICIKYERQGNEEEYNPSWARSG